MSKANPDNYDCTDFPTKGCRQCGRTDRPQWKGICNDDSCSQWEHISAFDEWWMLEAQNIVGVGRRTEKDYVEDGWKAALKWAKAIHDVVSEPKFSCIIKEELNE